MSMPLLEVINPMQKLGKTFSWTLRSNKGKIIYVNYSRGELKCRYDNEYNGRLFFQKKFVTKIPEELSTLQMLEITGFKLNHG